MSKPWVSVVNGTREVLSPAEAERIDPENLPILVAWMRKHGYQRVAGADPQTCVALNDLMNMVRVDQYNES
jgi:hypothetical protein